MVTYSRSPWRCRSSLWKEMEQSGASVRTLPESQAVRAQHPSGQPGLQGSTHGQPRPAGSVASSGLPVLQAFPACPS